MFSNLVLDAPFVSRMFVSLDISVNWTDVFMRVSLGPDETHQAACRSPASRSASQSGRAVWLSGLQVLNVLLLVRRDWLERASGGLERSVSRSFLESPRGGMNPTYLRRVRGLTSCWPASSRLECGKFEAARSIESELCGPPTGSSLDSSSTWPLWSAT